MLFGAICFVGAVVTAFSAGWRVMAAGRLIFGLGAESLIVAVTTAIAKWFRGKELSFAFGINLTIARARLVRRPQLAHLGAPRLPELAAAAAHLGAVLATFCVIGRSLYWMLEARRGAQLPASARPAGTDKVVFRDLFSFGRSYWSSSRCA